MKTKVTNALIGVQAAAALCVLGAIKLWAPVCGKMLELANGNQVHMKCYYTGQAAMGVAVILLAAAVMAFWAKSDYKKLMVVSAAAGVVLFLVFGGLIGVCASETMPCRITALWGKGAAGVSVVSSLVVLFSGKEGQVPS